MPSTTEIANLALSHLAIGTVIGNLTSDESANAKLVRRFFAVARDEVFRKFPWPFARRFESLTLVETEPTGEWAYSYRWPDDCIAPRRVLSYARRDILEVPFLWGSDSAGQLIYTDMAEAVLEFTARIIDTGTYPADFTQALSLRLAAYIAPTATAGDQFKLGQRAEQLFRQALSEAQASSVSGGQASDQAAPSTLESSRG